MKRSKPNVDFDKSYNIKEVCDFLGIHRDTLRKYTKEEVIVCIRVTCREIYYKGSEILILWEFLSKRKGL